MRNRREFLLAGLCVGALGAMLVAAAELPRHVPAVPVAVAEAATHPANAAEVSEAPEEPAPTPTPEKKDDTGKLAASLRDATYSAVVYDRAEKRFTTSYRPDAGYTSASVVKLLIAFEALKQGVRTDLVRRMLSRSDDDIASQLWSKLGGPDIVSRWAATIGLSGTRPPADPGRWGDTRITASSVVKIYNYLLDKASAADRSVVLAALRGATNYGSDGFDQYFGIPAAAGQTPWAIKQGWSCCRPGRTLHTTGLLGENSERVIVVLTSFPESVTYSKAAKAVTDAVRVLLR
jgi:hypothetical protein